MAKAVLRTPSNQSNHRRRYQVVSSMLLDHRLHMWSLSDGVKFLWSLLQEDLKFLNLLLSLLQVKTGFAGFGTDTVSKVPVSVVLGS